MKDAVAIIVLNWNGWQDTLQCLDSLRKVENPTIRVYVVDNGSTNESVPKLRSYLANLNEGEDMVLIENEENLGFSGGMNVGMQRALDDGYDWLLLLNNDVIVDARFLVPMLNAADEDAQIGMVNPKIYLLEEPDMFWSIGGRVNWMKTRGWHVGYRERDIGQYDQPPVQETAYATGGCVLLRRAMLEQIGLMPDIYFVYYEDVEWSLRAQRAGWRTVVVPEAKIWHKGAASAKEASDTYIQYHVRNGLIHARRMGTPLSRVAAYSVSVLRFMWQLVKWVLLPKRRRWARATMRGIRDAWAHREGKIQTLS